MIGDTGHRSLGSGGTEDTESINLSTLQPSSEAANPSSSGQIGTSLRDSHRLDIVTLSKVLFERARTHASLQLIPSVQRELIVNALYETGGNYVQAANLLGITRSTLRKRLDKFGIKQHFLVH
jgi:DNA-binding protein Fis